MNVEEEDEVVACGIFIGIDEVGDDRAAAGTHALAEGSTGLNLC